MATLLDLVSKVRTELNDQPRQFTKTILGDGTTTDFNLGVKPLDLTTLMVTVNGTVKANPTDYTAEANYGVIHFGTAPALNAVIVVSGNVFRYFSDADLEYYINTAVTQHTYNRSDAYGRAMTIDLLPEVETYPLALLATIEALYALSTDAAFDIDIQAPDGVTIPRSERFRQLTSFITQRQEQYKNLCAALNIGLSRIEMATLRRVSRTTNKLVPVYLAQEIDDARMPERVYLQNDLTGRTPLPSTVPIYDIILTQGDSWSAIFDFPDTTDFTTQTFTAQIRSFPGSPSLWASFTITVYDSVLKKLQLSLTSDQTTNIPTRAWWDIQATNNTDSNIQTTYMRGQIFNTPQVTEV
jgi:hypothetical protein